MQKTKDGRTLNDYEFLMRDMFATVSSEDFKTRSGKQQRESLELLESYVHNVRVLTPKN
jgi:hypothetical protein